MWYFSFPGLVTLLLTFGVLVGRVEDPGLIGPVGGTYRIGQAKNPGPDVFGGGPLSWLDDPDGPAMAADDGSEYTQPCAYDAAFCGTAHHPTGIVDNFADDGSGDALRAFIEDRRQEAILRKRERNEVSKAIADVSPPSRQRPTAAMKASGPPGGT